MHTETVVNEILIRAKGTNRLIIAICGPPGAGKSTLADSIAETLTKTGSTAEVLPMDGFHFDDVILEAHGWRARKGAPHTFDANGFFHTLSRIRDQKEDVCVPVFDRSLELSRAGARIIEQSCPIIIVEGNYLLLEEKPWSQLNPLFDFTVFLDVSLQELESRSISRWLHYGFTRQEAQKRAQSNDLPNTRYVIDNSAEADMVLKNQ